MKNMVRLVVILAVAALATLQAHATVLMYDTFTQADGDLVGHTPDVPGSGAWYTFSGANPLVTVGNKAIVDENQSQDDGYTYGGTHTADALYGSAVINLSTAPSGTTYFMAFHQDATTFYAGKIFAVSDGLGGFQLGCSYGANSVQSPLSASLSLNTDYTIAFEQDSTGGISNQTMRVWINPVSEGSPSLLATDGSAFVDDLNAIALRQSGGEGVIAVDNLKIGTSFADVIPEPSTIFLVITGLVGLLAIRRRS
jgi:hypothetical protein